eukprot:240466_1
MKINNENIQFQSDPTTVKLNLNNNDDIGLIPINDRNEPLRNQQYDDINLIPLRNQQYQTPIQVNTSENNIKSSPYDNMDDIKLPKVAHKANKLVGITKEHIKERRIAKTYGITMSWDINVAKVKGIPLDYIESHK